MFIIEQKKSTVKIKGMSSYMLQFTYKNVLGMYIGTYVLFNIQNNQIIYWPQAMTYPKYV